MERLHPRTDRQARQRRLAAIAAALGLILGITFGATLARAEAVAGDVAAPAPAPVPAPAEGLPPPWEPTPGSGEGTISLLPLLAKVSLGLGFVVLLAWGSVYLLRRTALGQGVTSAGSAVRVLDRNWLGPKKAIYLVGIGGRTLALGVTEESISVLSAWEAGELELAPPRSSGPGAFATQLRSLMARGRAAAGQEVSR